MLSMRCLLFLSPFILLVSEDPKPSDATIGAKPPEGAQVLFDGKSLEGWTHHDGKPASWKVTDGVFAVAPKTGDIQTKDKFGSFQMHVEFNVPYMPKATGQARGNSGIYLDGIYELQVLDSYGLKLQDNDCGAIYKQITPRVNACKPPLQWQTYDITFHKAVREGDKIIKKGRLTVLQNNIPIIEDADISATPGGSGAKEGEDGPMMLQDHGNDVQYRNLWVLPLK